ncbi:MAG: hypothetical protein II779_08695 [Clostridia bacterium]|nr:hypothetical protein [Clostridia bacterium]
MTYSEFRNQFASTDSFMWAYGRLSIEEARALIEAENTSATVKACMMTAWREARRKVMLRHVDVYFMENSSLSVVFHEYDSDYDGHDYEYRFSLDADNTDAFLKMIPHPSAEMRINIEDWLCENIQCGGFGDDLQREWSRMGLHGRHVVREDYPGGIYREEAF